MEEASEVRRPRKTRDPSKPKAKGKKGTIKASALTKATVGIENVPRRSQAENTECNSGQETPSELSEPSYTDLNEAGEAALCDVEPEDASPDVLKDQCSRQAETIRVLQGKGEQWRRDVEGAQATTARVNKDLADMKKTCNEKATLLTQMTFIIHHDSPRDRSAAHLH